MQVTLTSTFRPGTNVYRAKATFSTPLALAEFISLMTPFFLHFGFTPRINPIIRLGCFLMIPITFIAVRMTDARLGLVGMLVSLLLYGALWTIVRWRSNPRDLLAAAAVYAYPLLFVGGLGAIMSSHRAKMMLLGDQAQASSTAARDTQLGMALAKLWKHPWGFGSGQSGDAMGFAKGDFITIDNYFIVISLDYGLLGILFWYGLFVIAIITAVRYCISPEHGHRPEAKLLAPLAVCLAAFLIIKWVHGQADNHSIFFMFLGMVSALVYRIRHEPAPEVAKPKPTRRVSDRGASDGSREAYVS
ncbi:MAG: O-antigen ligase family protein [Proteobacteria bacterium]|nr:O-antigen ligase family protein [Pseudomonadota bacterium]